jgi:hypothetical protein
MTRWIILILIAVLLGGCSASSDEPTQNIFSTSDMGKTSSLAAATSPVTTPTYTVTISAETSSATLTRTLMPTLRSTFIPSNTPTFGFENVKTHTPVSPAQCPAQNPKLTPEIDDFSYTSGSGHPFLKVLDFLNSGGTRQAVIAAYLQYDPDADDRFIREQDVTADGIPELLVTTGNTFAAFVCQDGQVQDMTLIGQTYHYFQPVIADITDMTLDGVPEIIAIEGDARIRIVSVFAFDGTEFQQLNADFENTYPDPCSDLLGESWAYAQDTDNNGLLELVLKQDIPTWSEYSTGLPWRPETRVCSWNGTGFVLTGYQIDTPPEYRFQAVQDGDRAALAGDNVKALDLYQQAIFSDQLDWWSQSRSVYERNHERPLIGPPPTPDSSVQIDPAEYPNLAAYARYRIMLLHTVQGYLPEAKTVYDTLQEKFPAGQTGHAYAEMASAFWMEYQFSGNLEQACGKAIEYAASHPAEVLTYLGNSAFSQVYFGDQSLNYTPEDICPYK